MFAGIESLIGLLVFVVISVLASWLQKKQQSQQEPPSLPPRRPRGQSTPPPRHPQPAPQPVSWEEELKRLLEGQTAEPPPPPPPPIVVPHRQPAPPPSLPRESAHPIEHSPVEVTFKALPGLTESTLAYAEASTLEEKVQQHLRDVTRRPVAMTHVQHKASSREAAEALNLVRNPKSVRSAILASIILGPPRALAE
jgi:hypothetical protein